MSGQVPLVLSLSNHSVARPGSTADCQVDSPTYGTPWLDMHLIQLAPRATNGSYRVLPCP
jgi:hypothetical protein